MLKPMPLSVCWRVQHVIMMMINTFPAATIMAARICGKMYSKKVSVVVVVEKSISSG